MVVIIVYPSVHGYRQGEVVEVPEELGARWVELGLAEQVRSAQEFEDLRWRT